MLSDTDGALSQEVLPLRVKYQRRCQASNLGPPAGQPVLDMELTHGETPTTSIWYEDGTPLGRYVRLFDLLSGDILRLNRDPLPCPATSKSKAMSSGPWKSVPTPLTPLKTTRKTPPT